MLMSRATADGWFDRPPSLRTSTGMNANLEPTFETHALTPNRCPTAAQTGSCTAGSG